MTSFITTNLTIEQFRIVESILNESETTSAKINTIKKNLPLFWNMIGLNNIHIFMLRNLKDNAIQEYCTNFIGQLIMTYAPKKGASTKVIVGDSGCLDAIVSAMETHATTSSRLQLLGFHVLAMACADSPENSRRLGNAKGFEGIAQRAVRDTRGQVIIDGLLMIGGVAKHNPRARSAMHTLGIPAAIVSIIRGNGHEKAEKVSVIGGLRALGALYLGKPRVDPDADGAPKEAVVAVLEAMAEHKDNAVYARGCYALAALANGVHFGRDDQIKTDAVDAVLQLVSKNLGNPQVLSNALKFLNNVCCGFVPPPRPPPPSAQQQQQESQQQQSHGLHIFKEKKAVTDDIIYDDEEDEALNDLVLERIAAGDGFKIVSRALGKNSRVEKVQAHGCALLGKFARCKGTEYAKTVDLVLTAMNKHGGSVPVQTSAFFALSRTVALYNSLLRQQGAGPNSSASNAAVQMAMGINKTRVGASFVKLVFRAFGELPASLSLQKWGCAALAELGKHSPENKALIRGGNVDWILRDIRAKDEQTVADALAVLGYFTADNTRAMIGSKHAMETLVPILDSDYAEPVIALCLKVIANIVGKNSSNRAAFRECGGIEATVRAITRFAESAAVTGRGGQALETAVDNCPPSKTRIREAGGVQLLIAGVSRHGQVPKHLARIVSSIAAIVANNAENTNIVVVANAGVQPIIDTMNCWSQNVSVQRSCTRALSALSNSAANNIRGYEIDTGEVDENTTNTTNDDNDNTNDTNTAEGDTNETNIVDGHKIVEVLIKANVLESVFKAMYRAQDDDRIQAYGLLAASALCSSSSEACERLLRMENSPLQHIIFTISRRISSGITISKEAVRCRDPSEIALKMIADLAFVNEGIRHEFIKCGGAQCITALLKAALGWGVGCSPVLVANGLQALEHVIKPRASPHPEGTTAADAVSTEEHGEKKDETSDSAERVGTATATEDRLDGYSNTDYAINAIELTPPLLVKFREYKDVVDCGVHLLAKLVPRGGDDIILWARKCKAPEAILRSLRKHPEFMELQQLGLSTLATLTSAPKKAPRPVSSSSSILTSSSSSSSALTSSLSMGSIPKQGDEGKGSSSNSGGGGGGGSNNSSIRELLGILSAGEGAVNAVTGSGAGGSGGSGERPVDYSDDYMSSVLDPMRRYKDNNEIQGNGCVVLRNLMRTNERYKNAMGSEGNDSINLLFVAARNSDEVVATEALGTLAKATHWSLTNCTRALAVPDCVFIITNAMVKHLTSTQVQGHGWRTLASLAGGCSQDVANALKSSGIFPGVISTLEYLIKSSPLITRVGNYALAILSRGSSVGAAVVADSGGIETVICGLKTYPDEELLQRWGLSALNGMTGESLENQKRLIASGGIDVLVHALKAFPGNKEIQEDGCATIGRVSTVDAATARHVESSIGVRAIVRTIRMYVGNAKIQEFALQALANISEGSAEVPAEVVDSDGVEAIVASLKKFAPTASIVCICLHVLGNVLALSEASKARLERCRGVEQILAALSRHILDPDVQREGATALSAAVQGSDSIKRRVDEAGGIRILVTNTIHNFTARPDVLCAGFLALASAADNSTRIQKAVETCGGLEDVLVEMDRYRHDAQLQEAGLRALATFTQFSNTAPGKIARSKYEISGIFEALARFGDDRQGLTLHATRTLAHMSGKTNPENVTSIIRCGGVARILELMARYAHVARIQRYCIVILTNVSLVPENTPQVTESGAISALVAAMNNFKPQKIDEGDANSAAAVAASTTTSSNDNNCGEEVQRAGIIAIECIVTRTKNVAGLHLEDSGAIRAIVDGMGSMSAAYREYVIRSACTTFARIARGNAANSLEICAAGGVTEMLNGVREYPENLEIQNLAVNTLGNIALFGGAKAQRVIWHSGGIEAVIQIMRSSTRNYTIQEQCCFALSTIAAEVPEVKVHAINAGALVAVAAAMDKYGKLYEIQSDGCLALARITNRVKMTSFSDEKAPDLSTQILSAMTSFGEDKDIQRCGCQAIANTARGRKDAIDHFIDAGAPKVIVRAMALHPTVVQVQECACKALTILASFAGGGRHIESFAAPGSGAPGSNGSMGSIGGGVGPGGNSGSSGSLPLTNSGSGNLGGIVIVGTGAIAGSSSACVDAVLGAMNRHQSVMGVQYHGCRALAALLQNTPQNQFVIGNGGGIESILRAATQFPDNSKLQEHALLTLSILTSENIPNLGRFCSNDGINVVATSMNRFATNSKVQLFSLHILFNTLAMEDGAMVLGPHIYAVIKAAAVFTVNEEIEDLALCLIARMITNEMNLVAAGCPECVSAVAAALLEHITSTTIRRNSCFIFSRLAAASREFAFLIADNGGIPSILKAAAVATVKDKTPETIGLAVHALRDIARAGAEPRRKIELCDGVKTLVDAASLVCGKNQKIVDDSCIAIEYILSPEDCELFSSNNEAPESDKTVTKALLEAFFSRVSLAYPTSPLIQQATMCSRRELPPRTKAAIEAGFCSNVSLDRCLKLDCPWYCHMCNAPQWAYICETCKEQQKQQKQQQQKQNRAGAGGSDVFWCEVCWRKHHSGHKGTRMFIPCHCACTDPVCQEMQLAYMGSKGVSRWVKSLEVERSVGSIFLEKNISGNILFELTGKQILCLGVSVSDSIVLQDTVASLDKKRKKKEKADGAISAADSSSASSAQPSLPSSAAPSSPSSSHILPSVPQDTQGSVNVFDPVSYRCHSKIVALGDIYAEQQKSFYMTLNTALISSGFGPIFPEIQAEYERFVSTHPGVSNLLQNGILSNRDVISIFLYTSYKLKTTGGLCDTETDDDDDDEFSTVFSSPYDTLNSAMRGRAGTKDIVPDVEMSFLNMQGYLLYLLSALRKLTPYSAERKPLYCGVDSSTFEGFDNFSRIDETFVWPSFVLVYTSEDKVLEALSAQGAKSPVVFEISGKCYGYDITPFTQPSPETEFEASRPKDILLEPETKFRIVSVTRDKAKTVKRVYLDIIKTPLLLLDQVKMFHLNGPLPDNWSSNYDALTNKIYYENKKTGFLQWKDPLNVPLSDIFDF